MIISLNNITFLSYELYGLTLLFIILNLKRFFKIILIVLSNFLLNPHTNHFVIISYLIFLNIFIYSFNFDHHYITSPLYSENRFIFIQKG